MRYILHFANCFKFLVFRASDGPESCFIALAPKIRPDKRFVPSEGNRSFFRRVNSVPS